MAYQNENFGFTTRGVNLNILSGPINYFFKFLLPAYRGLQQGPMVADLFHVMNPEEILAAAAGWAESARARDVSVVDEPAKFYCNLVARGYESHFMQLNIVKSAGKERGVAPFGTNPGDLESRLKLVAPARAHALEVLSDEEKLRADIMAGLYERDQHSDMATRGGSNRRKLAAGISKILKCKYDAYRQKRPVEFAFGETLIGVERSDGEFVEMMVYDALPKMIESVPNEHPLSVEYNVLHDHGLTLRMGRIIVNGIFNAVTEKPAKRKPGKTLFD